MMKIVTQIYVSHAEEYGRMRRERIFLLLFNIEEICEELQKRTNINN